MNTPSPPDAKQVGLLLADLADAWVGAERLRIETIEKAIVRFRGALERLAQTVAPPSPPPPPQEDDGRQLLDRKSLRQLVPYSGSHIDRLEWAGKFPKRIRLNEGRRSRVAWSKDEVMAWIASRRTRGGPAT